jgi:hypothetical protein
MLKSHVTPQPKAEHESQIALAGTGLPGNCWLHFNIFCRRCRSPLSMPEMLGVYQGCLTYD